MKRIFFASLTIATGLTLFGCNGKPAKESAPVSRNESAATSKAVRDEAQLAVKFLQGVQQGDKNALYAVTNLTPEMVSESRDKLIRPEKYKLDKGQVTENEHVLRVSGQIDFFTGKLRKLLPKSATFDVATTTSKETAENPWNSRSYTHTVKIAYGNEQEAVRDKTGRAIKEMTVELQHAVRIIAGKPVHEISFAGADFEKMADKEFTVSSYF